MTAYYSMSYWSNDESNVWVADGHGENAFRNVATGWVHTNVDASHVSPCPLARVRSLLASQAVASLTAQVAHVRYLATATKATPDDAGCWIDGHWGQYGVSRVVEIAGGYGWADDEAAALAAQHQPYPGPSMMDDADGAKIDSYERLIDAADDAEAWLHAYVAPEGFYFGWSDGEFVLWSAETWEES